MRHWECLVEQVRRVADGVQRLVELLESDEPIKMTFGAEDTDPRPCAPGYVRGVRCSRGSDGCAMRHVACSI